MKRTSRKMDGGQKLSLFFKLGLGGLSLVLLAIGATIYHLHASPDASVKEGLQRFLIILAVASCGAIAVIWVKTKQGILAFETGEPLVAKVYDIRFNSNDVESDDRYVLIWRDQKGNFGESYPRRRDAFDAYEQGDEITVYQGPNNETWWEMDLPGKARQ